MKPRVLIISPNFYAPESFDGVNKIIFNLLVQNDSYTVDFVHLYPKPNDVEEFGYIKSSYWGFEYKENKKSKKLLPWLLGTRPFVSLTKSIAKEVAYKVQQVEKDYDVIHLGHLGLGSILKFLPSGIRDKTLLMAVDSYSLYMNRRVSSKSNLIRKMLFKRELRLGEKYEEQVYKMVPKVTFVSEVDKKHSEEKYNQGNFINISLGVDTDYFSPSSIKKKSTQIIFTGNFGYGPNIDAASFLVEDVLPLVSKVLPNTHLILAGINPSETLLGLEDKSITVTGFVDDLRPYLLSSSLFICPLRYGAGMKNKLLEAFSLSMTVIASSLSVEGINCEDKKHCIVLRDMSPEFWANKIIEVLSMSEEYKQLGLNARELVISEYSWEKTRQGYAEIYRSYLN